MSATKTSARTMAAQWASYRELVMSGDAGQVQVSETQQAFYAGAQAIFGLVFSGLSEGDDSTPADEAFMASVMKELQEFARTKGWKPESER